MQLNQCPVCSSTNFHQVLEARDHLVSRETFNICQCLDCTVRFTNPRPEAAQLGKYYQSEDYISHTNESNNLVNRLYKVARFFTLRHKRKLLEKNSRSRKLLDLGCGTGHFLHHCAGKGWQTTGIEPDEKAREIAIKENHLKVVPSLDMLNDSGYDRITLWHVLEHLPELKETLRRLATLLNDNGHLFIAVPNYLAYEENIFREYWAAYDVPRHLYHFSPKSMAILTKNNGLKIEEIYPMWLDSFYISLLSNKHKFQRNKYLNSFIKGSLSNIYGLKTGNYSSLIYKISKTR